MAFSDSRERDEYLDLLKNVISAAETLSQSFHRESDGSGPESLTALIDTLRRYQSDLKAGGDPVSGRTGWQRYFETDDSTPERVRLTELLNELEDADLRRNSPEDYQRCLQILSGARQQENTPEPPRARRKTRRNLWSRQAYPNGCVMLFGAIFMIAFGWYGFFAWKDAASRRAGMPGWLSVEGSIVEARLINSLRPGKFTSGYRAEIDYQYQVGSERYEGRLVDWKSTRESAESLIEYYIRGAVSPEVNETKVNGETFERWRPARCLVEVFHDPENPGDSALRIEKSWPAFDLLISGLLVLTFSAGALAFLTLLRRIASALLRLMSER